MIKTAKKEDPIRKRPLGRPCLRQEDYVKRDFKTVNLNVNWREVAKDRDMWRAISCTGWS